MLLVTCRTTLVSRGLAVLHSQRFGWPSHDTADASGLVTASPLLATRHFVPYINSILPSWVSDYALDRQLGRIKCISGWNEFVLASTGSLSGDQALMCLSELGDLTTERSTKPSQADAADDWSDGLDQDTTGRLNDALESLLLRLKQHTLRYKESGSRARVLDHTLLGSGLWTTWQLQRSAAGRKQAHKVLHLHGKVMQEILLNEGRVVTESLLNGPGLRSRPTVQNRVIACKGHLQ
eukprot:jgi/Ulvmu1/11062/UM007_0244.1